MKKKILVSILSAILALSMTACGAQAQPKVETEAPVVAEAPETTPEPAEEPEVEAPAKEAKTEEVVPEETETEELVEETETEVAETETEIDPMEALANSNMSSYVSDGVFDIEKFANDTGASWWANNEYCFILLYDDAWFVEAGNSDLRPDIGYVATGNWDASNDERSDFFTYSYIFPSGDDVQVSDIATPVECIIHLSDIVSFIKNNGADIVPNVSSTVFKPCNPTVASEQTE